MYLNQFTMMIQLVASQAYDEGSIPFTCSNEIPQKISRSGDRSLQTHRPIRRAKTSAFDAAAQ
jgi:hypothetical protein